MSAFRSYLKGKFRKLLNRALLNHYMYVGEEARLSIAPTAKVNNAFFNLYSGKIVIEEYAFFGFNVSVLTGTHDYTQFERARMEAVPASGRDVTIRRGAFVATNATIIGPCEIGMHAVVAAGAVVTKDVPAYAVVAGVPARVVNMIDPGGATADEGSSGLREGT